MNASEIKMLHQDKIDPIRRGSSGNLTERRSTIIVIITKKKLHAKIIIEIRFNHCTMLQLSLIIIRSFIR